MAFKFTWPTFSNAFYETASDLLTSALSKAPTPPIITDSIVVKELNFGTTAPELEMLEIGELGPDRFRGVFKLNYSGDAFIVLQTKVQANPLNTRSQLTPSFTSRGILAADVPLTVPMFLRLSSLQLSGIIILVFSKQKGLTLVFRNDPVDSVKVSSTFDSIPAIQRFLQAEIERILRDLMREEVPAIIHKLSLEWTMKNQADECLSPASLTNTQQLNKDEKQSNYQYSLEMEPNDPLRPILAETNLLRLAELNGAHRTLSLFTPSIPSSVFRSSTTLVSQLQSRYARRRDWPSIKSSEPESQPQPSTYFSPPESVHSSQSVETSSVSVRPSLSNYRQRSSYLRRPLQPKRTVVWLNPKPASESASNKDTTSESGDCFSEPGGYTYLEYQWSNKDSLSKSKLEEAALRDAVWLKTKDSFSLPEVKGDSTVSSEFTAPSQLSGSTIVGSSGKGDGMWKGSPGDERVLPNF